MAGRERTGAVAGDGPQTLPAELTLGLAFVVPSGRHEVRVTIQDGLPGAPETHTCTFENS